MSKQVATLKPTTAATKADRDNKGKWVAGNKAGLLPRRKQEIVALKENLEYAVRGPAGPISVERTVALLKRMWQMGMDGDVKAARLFLGIAMAPASEDTKGNAPPQIVIKVENATFSAVKATASKDQPPIDGEYTTKE